MSISLEMIDEMRKRTNCSYEEAKELLEKHNGDLLEAIVEFEKKYGHAFKHRHFNKHHQEFKNCSGFGQKIKNLIHKGFKTKVVIEKEGTTYLNIPVNILILAVIFTMPVFWIYPLLLVAIYLMGYKISIRKEKGQDIVINKFVDDIGNRVKTAADKMGEKPEENKEKKDNDKDDDDYNEITVE